MLPGEFLAAAILFAITALALNLDELLARRFWAITVMARGSTLVPTEQAWLGAALAAQFACLLAVSLVAGSNALVASTGERFTTGEATAEAALGAGNGLALLVVAVTPFCGEHHAGRADGRRMAVMLRRMLAAVSAGAWSLADGLLGATGHRWIDDLCTALAVELLEAAAIAGRAVATVTWLIAFVASAAQGAIAGQRAGVIDIDATLGVALVLATATFLGATSLAASVIRSR